MSSERLWTVACPIGRNSDMHSALVVGCGGAGCRVVSRICASFDFPALRINVSDADINVVPDSGNTDVGFKGDRDEAYYHAMFIHNEEIVEKIRGHSTIIGVAALGGGTGAGAIIALAQCARSLDIPFISVVYMPWKFETERRSEALKELPDVQKVSDRMFLMDNECAKELGETTINMGRALEGAELLMKHAAVKVAILAETTPFLSLMSSRCYTFSYGSESSLLGSVEQALAFPLYPADPVGKKVVICPDAPASDLERELVVKTVADRTGLCPDFVQGDLEEGNGAFIFLPISCRSPDSS